MGQRRAARVRGARAVHGLGPIALLGQMCIRTHCCVMLLTQLQLEGKASWEAGREDGLSICFKLSRFSPALSPLSLTECTHSQKLKAEMVGVSWLLFVYICF